MAADMTRPLGKSTVTLMRAPLVTDSRDQSQYRDWGNATETLIANCLVEPLKITQTREDNRAREFFSTSYRVFIPPNITVLPTDRIVHQGVTFEVFGQPSEWRDMQDVWHHTTVNLIIRGG